MTKAIPGFTAAMRQECAETARGILDPSENYRHDAHKDFETYAWEVCSRYGDIRAHAAQAILAMPVAPPFPEPMREAPERMAIYWLAMPHLSDFCMETEWWGNKSDLLLLSRGLCHATREPAAAHGRYLASLSAKPEGGT